MFFFDRRLTLQVKLGYEDGIIQIFREDGAQRASTRCIQFREVESQEDGSEKGG